MKRSSKGLSNSGSGLKRTRMKQRSDERSKFMREVRAPQVKALRESGERCLIGPMLADEGFEEWRNCVGEIGGLHERRKRSAGGSLTNPSNLVPACNLCNGLIEDSHGDLRAWFHEVGLVVKAGDDEWDDLGA